MVWTRDQRLELIAAYFGSRGAEEWQTVVRHFELSDVPTFGLIVIQVPDVTAARVLAGLLEQQLNQADATLEVWEPATPDDLVAMSEQLLAANDASPTAGAMWVTAVDMHPERHSRWAESWRTLSATLNEHRDGLRAQVARPLIFVGTPGLKRILRESAPDLWSVRTLVVEFDVTEPTPTEQVASLASAVATTAQSTPASWLQEPRFLRFHYPGGRVRDRHLYVPRPVEQRRLITALLDRRPVLITAPRQFGKTTLLHHATRELVSMLEDPAVIWIDLSMISTGEPLAHFVGNLIRDQVNLSDSPYADSTRRGSDWSKLHAWMKQSVLPSLRGPLVLVFDESDALARVPERIAFFAQLRAWCEAEWPVRIVMASARPLYRLEDSPVYRSPFSNIAEPIELPEFDLKQVGDLAVRYGLHVRDGALRDLMAMIGGHPYLAALAMYGAANHGFSSWDLRDHSDLERSIFGMHLSRLARFIGTESSLAHTAKKLLSGPQPIHETEICDTLYALGMITRVDRGNLWRLRCPVYEWFVNEQSF